MEGDKGSSEKLKMVMIKGRLAWGERDETGLLKPCFVFRESIAFPRQIDIPAVHIMSN